MATKKKQTTKSKTYGFSMNRALGITKLKSDFARKTGIPTTKAGMQRKFDRIVTKSLFAKRGILFWAGIILFFPITLPIFLVKNHNQKKAQYFEAIENYYIEQFPQDFLESADTATVLFQAEQFKQYFDTQKMPKPCRQYYLEKYESIVTFINTRIEPTETETAEITEKNAIQNSQKETIQETEEEIAATKA